MATIGGAITGTGRIQAAHFNAELNLFTSFDQAVWRHRIDGNSQRLESRRIAVPEAVIDLFPIVHEDGSKEALTLIVSLGVGVGEKYHYFTSADETLRLLGNSFALDFTLAADFSRASDGRILWLDSTINSGRSVVHFMFSEGSDLTRPFGGWMDNPRADGENYILLWIRSALFLDESGSLRRLFAALGFTTDAAGAIARPAKMRLLVGESVGEVTGAGWTWHVHPDLSWDSDSYWGGNRKPPSDLRIYISPARRPRILIADNMANIVVYLSRVAENRWRREKDLAIDRAFCPAISWALGKRVETRSPKTPELTDVVFPVEEVHCCGVQPQGPQPTRYDSISMERSLYCYARRRALKTAVGEKKILVGIIEGPPPIPEENINLDPKLHSTKPAGETAIVNTQSETIGYEAIGSISGLVSVKTELGALIFSAGYSMEAEAGWRGSTKESAMLTASTTASNLLNLEGPTGTQRVQPLGTALLFGLSFSGYAFEYIDEREEPLPGAAPFYQVFPIAAALTAHSYLLNSKIAPTPGRLETYIVSPERLLELKNDSIPAEIRGVDSSYMVTSWSLSSGTKPMLQRVDATQSANSVFVDLKVMGGFKVGFLGEKGSIDVGIRVKLDRTWTTAYTKSTTFSSTVTVPGNIHAAGSYHSYEYFTYVLCPDAKWAKEFIDNLVLADWPVDGNERDLNQTLKDSLYPFTGTLEESPHKPWMIRYVLGERAKVKELLAAAAAGGVTLSQDLLSKLRAHNITTTAELTPLLARHATREALRVVDARPDVSEPATDDFEPEEVELLGQIHRAAR